MVFHVDKKCFRSVFYLNVSESSKLEQIVLVRESELHSVGHTHIKSIQTWFPVLIVVTGHFKVLTKKELGLHVITQSRNEEKAKSAVVVKFSLENLRHPGKAPERLWLIFVTFSQTFVIESATRCASFRPKNVL